MTEDYIKDSAGKGTFSHAFIIEGGDGKKMLEAALEISLCLMCEGEAKPCLKCKECKKIIKRVHPDIIEVSPKKDRVTIGVDTIREISRDSYILPNEGAKKIYIFTKAEVLTEAAQNALLKTLEEPPSHAVFILLLKEGEGLLQTVLSRCIKLYTKSDFGAKSKKSSDFPLSFLKSLITGSEFDFILLSNNLPKTREALTDTLDGIRKTVRDILIVKNKSGVPLYNDDKREDIEFLASRYHSKQLVKLFDTAEKSKVNIESNFNLSLAGMLFFIKCWEEVH